MVRSPFKPRRVLSDNGSELKAGFTQTVLEALGGKKQLKADFGRKKTGKSWERYARIICQAAAFFSAPQNYRIFKASLSNTHTNDLQALFVPVNLLCQAVPDLDAILAFNFLKELGYIDYVKPDPALINICMRAGLVDLKKVQRIADQKQKKKPKLLPKAPKKSKYPDYGQIVVPRLFFIELVALCKSQGILPYEFDRLMWLVNSGKFILPNGELMQIKSSGKEFLAQSKANEAINAAKLKHAKSE